MLGLRSQIFKFRCSLYCKETYDLVLNKINHLCQNCLEENAYCAYPCNNYLCFEWAGWWCALIAVHGYFRLAAFKHGLGEWSVACCYMRINSIPARLNSTCCHFLFAWLLSLSTSVLLEFCLHPAFSHVCFAFFHCYPVIKSVSCERQDIYKICHYSIYKSTFQTLICYCNHTLFINCGSQRLLLLPDSHFASN